jgi:hypothetical protein
MSIVARGDRDVITGTGLTAIAIGVRSSLTGAWRFLTFAESCRSSLLLVARAPLSAAVALY